MITSNVEHKKAKLQKVNNILKVGVPVSLIGVVTFVTVFVYSNVIKVHDIDFEDDLRGGYKLSASTVEMLSNEIEKTYKSDIIDNYEEHLKEQAKENISASLASHDVYFKSTYNPQADGLAIVEMDNLAKGNVLWSLDRFEEKNNPDVKLTVDDLRSVRYLDSIYAISVFRNSDIAWLNYCDNLNSLELEITSQEALKQLKQIKGLNVSSLYINVDRSFFGNGVSIDDEYFSFLKNCPNLRELKINTQVFSIENEFLDKFKRNDSEIHLMNFNGTSQKIDIDTLLMFKKVVLCPSYGKGIYDMANLYTREEFKRFSSSDCELEVLVTTQYANDSICDIDEFVSSVNETYNQIDDIMANLQINEKMSDKTKLNAVLEFVLKDLSYSKSASEIMDEEGYESNIFGSQPQSLVDDLTENSYKDGYLYGALSKDGKPVCGNYAALMKVLLNKAGLEAYIAESDYHAYNLVNVDGEYYYVDATFLDRDVIDMDLITSNDKHLIYPQISDSTYNTNIIPQNVDLAESFSAEARAQQIIDNVKHDYKVKFNNQVFTLSLTALIALLAGLGLAKSKKELDNLEELEELENMSYRGVLREILYLKRELLDMKKDYEKANILKKAYLKLTGKANFGEMQERIDRAEDIKKKF